MKSRKHAPDLDHFVAAGRQPSPIGAKGQGGNERGGAACLQAQDRLDIPRSTGRSLREVLARGERPDRATLIDWGTQLLEILAEAHAEGALYRYLTEDEVLAVVTELVALGYDRQAIQNGLATSLTEGREIDYYRFSMGKEKNS